MTNELLSEKRQHCKMPASGHYSGLKKGLVKRI